ncbi:hypothetical protein CPC08DRAFT_667774 [Agrocybe pediades]|nr:hypothetical protein CPC08DRAFT_667774 [Agrocybe pediades]
MSIPKLPTVRMTPEGDCIIQDSVTLEFPQANKFSVSYATAPSRRNTTMDPPQMFQEAHPKLGWSEGEQQHSDGDSADDESTSSTTYRTAPPSRSSSTREPAPVRLKSVPEKPVPAFSRALSMPLPSQLSHLQNPHRVSRPPLVPLLSPGAVSTQVDHIREVSVELADSIQLIVQTMLQISPPQVLDPAKEQFSACALSVPTSSMSAMFTAMKNINYISANMSAFCEQTVNNAPTTESGQPTNDAQPGSSTLDRPQHNEFDIGEMLQCVGDALSGAAAQAGVDLVLYHGDVGLKHVYVSGDESGISFALSHIVRQVLNTTERGDSIELGLLVGPISSSLDSPMNIESPPVDDMMSASPLESTGPIQVKIRLSHKYTSSETQDPDQPMDMTDTEMRPPPSFSTSFLRRILAKIDGKLITDLPAPDSFASGRTCDLEMVLDRVPIPLYSASSPPELREEGISEPTLEQLSTFGETLKGKRVTLYASAKGSFAHHLTSYLTAWGMDVSHVSPDGHVDGVADNLTGYQEDIQNSQYVPVLPSFAEEPLSPQHNKAEPKIPMPTQPSFIFIDDDVNILKERLQLLRFENQPPLPSLPKKRPSLSARTRSSPHVARLVGMNQMRPPPVVIMHFTSLANYKVVRDAMQSLVISYAATSTPLPEVMIIPKPAGPRRFLTALHTAVTKPIVDPWFSPIATSPNTPGMSSMSGFFPSGSDYGSPGSNADSNASHPQPSSRHSNRPPGSRSNSDRSTRTNDHMSSMSSVLPPSPLAFPENVEYFSAAAERLGTSPSSGLVIQSPDGQTAGIYFHPRSKNASRNPSSQSMERDKGQLTIPIPRRGSLLRGPSSSKEEEITFSSLHEQTAGGQKEPPMRLMSIGPMEDQREGPSLASSILSPVPRRASEELRKLSSPTRELGTTLSRRPRRHDHREASSRKSKAVTTSDNVVPPISVLIVDDNPINQTILSTFMRRKRIKYELANNGQEAVQKWRTGGFHLILMDIQMPVMDGIQATKEIRRLEKCNATAGFPPISPAADGETPTNAPPEPRTLNSPYHSSVIIVALTASSLQSDRVAALAAGCNDFLTKPVSLLWLNNKIIEWGSIKALQMWADIRPDPSRNASSSTSATTNQDTRADAVAENLHVPEDKVVPAPPAVRRTSSAFEDNAAVIALASAGSSSNFSTAPSSPVTTSHSIPHLSYPSDSMLPPHSFERMRTTSMDATMTDANASHPIKRKRSSLDTDDDGAPAKLRPIG